MDVGARPDHCEGELIGGRHIPITLIWDRGGEKARHAEAAQLLTSRIYFTDPAGILVPRPTCWETQLLLRSFASAFDSARRAAVSFQPKLNERSELAGVSVGLRLQAIAF